MFFRMVFFEIFRDSRTESGPQKSPPWVRRQPADPPFGALRRRHRSNDVFPSILVSFLIDFQMILMVSSFFDRFWDVVRSIIG